jgi:hypothetical protein
MSGRGGLQAIDLLHSAALNFQVAARTSARMRSIEVAPAITDATRRPRDPCSMCLFTVEFSSHRSR